jgi:hypothetical protein
MQLCTLQTVHRANALAKSDRIRGGADPFVALTLGATTVETRVVGSASAIVMFICVLFCAAPQVVRVLL